MTHDHTHRSGQHPHLHAVTPTPSRERRALCIVLTLTAGFAVIEAVGGWYAGSLALLSDAGHMITDAGALAIALFAQHVAQRPPSQRASYGYARAEVLAAFTNALVMLAVIAGIAIEAVRRLLTPSPVAGNTVMLVAGIGLLINMVGAWMLSRGHSLNSRAALLHVFGDMLGSIAAIIAGAVVAWTGWLPIDPILSLFISLLILRSTWALLQVSAHVLMEGVPSHLSYEEIGGTLTRIDGVSAVHDLHIWQMSSDRTALSAHLLIRDPSRWPATLALAQHLLAERFSIDHVTLQPTWHEAQVGRRVIPVKPVKETGPDLR